MSKIKGIIKKIKPQAKKPKQPKEPKQPKQPKQPKEKRKLSKSFIIAIVVIVILILALVFILPNLMKTSIEDLTLDDNSAQLEILEDNTSESEENATNEMDRNEDSLIEEIEEIEEDNDIEPFVDSNIITYSFDGKVKLYDTADQILDEIDLKEIDIDRLYEFNNRSETFSRGDDSPVFTLKKPVKTEFKIYKKDGKNLFFGDIKRKIILEIGEKNGKIIAYEIIRDVKIGDIVNVSSTKGEYYLTMKDGIMVVAPGTGDVVGFSTLSLLKNEKPEILKKYKNKEITFAEYIESKGHLYFTIDSGLFRIDYSFVDKEIGDKKELEDFLSLKLFHYIDLGDEIIDLFSHNDEIYAINKFGFETNNSVLMKMGENASNELIISDMMELKGIYSKVIGYHNDKAYIRQSEFIKEVDLAKFKPNRAYGRTAGVPVMVNDGYVYTMVDGVVKISTLDDRDSPIKELNIEGDTFYKGPMLD